MNFKLIGIIQSCNTLHELKNEFKKPFGWLRLRSKKKAKELEIELEKMINTINEDNLDVNYFYNLERCFFTFYNDLKDYMINITIPSYNPEDKYNPKNFIPMYFYDESKNRNIIIEIISTNITFTVFDINTGRHLEIYGENKIRNSNSNKIVEKQCKEILINMLLDFLHENRLSPEEKANILANRY